MKTLSSSIASALSNLHIHKLTMEEAAAAPSSSSSLPSAPKFEPGTESIKRRILKEGVYPTPKIIHTLWKKEIQKHNRKLNRLSQTQKPLPLTPSQKQALLEESHFQNLKREYRDFTYPSFISLLLLLTERCRVCGFSRLSNRQVALRDWKLARVMKQSGLRFNEGQLLKIVEELGDTGKWKQAMVVVEWVYNDKDRRD